MKAAPEDQLALLGLQERDNHIAHLTQQRANIPEQAQLEATVNRLREFSTELIAKTEELEEARTELARIEEDVRVVDERAAKDREREAHSASVKDVQALESELASLAQRKHDLEEAELIVMQTVEDAEKALEGVIEQRDEIEAERGRLSAMIMARQIEIDNQIEAEKKSRAEIVASLPGDLVELYERQRARYGIGAALLARKISGGSGVELTETDLTAIRNTPADEVVICPDSSCILIRTAESGL